jgi:hypothetical protein
MVINDTLRDTNYSLFTQKLTENGVNSDKLVELYGESIKNASYSTTKSEGNAFSTKGGLLQVVMRILTPNALKVNEILPQELKQEKASIIKICMLSQISKSRMFTVDERGYANFSNDTSVLKLGARSLMMLSQAGISLSEDEYEAIALMDKNDSEGARGLKPLALILKMANDLTLMQTKIETDKEHGKN